MSKVLTYPSDEFPAPVSLTMTLPEEWEPLTAVGVHLGAVKTMPTGEFTPNVIVEVSRFGGAYTLKQAVELAQRNASAAKRYKYTRRADLTVAGAEGFVLDGVFPQPRGGALMQTVRLAVVERASVVDLVQITGTCAQSQEAIIWESLQQIADSVSPA